MFNISLPDKSSKKLHVIFNSIEQRKVINYRCLTEVSMQYLGSESLGVIVKSDWARHDVTLSVAMTLDWLCCVVEGGGYLTAR